MPSPRGRSTTLRARVWMRERRSRNILLHDRYLSRFGGVARQISADGTGSRGAAGHRGCDQICDHDAGERSGSARDE